MTQWQREGRSGDPLQRKGDFVRVLVTGRRPQAARAASTASRLLRLVPVLVVLLLLAAWELGVRQDLVSSLFYPPPSAIFGALLRLAENGVLGASLGSTLRRILVGFALGGSLGLVLGLAMGWSKSLRLALDPLVAAAHPVPRLALLPLVLLLFGIGEAARVVIVALSCLFPLLINATTGVRQIASAHFEVARSFGAGRWHVFTQVVLPGSLPSVLAGARLSLISAFKTTLGIELITAEDGLGHLIWFAWEAFRPEELYATLLVIAGLGVVLSAGLARIVALAQPGRAAVAP